nr:MAG TPA: zinc-ribbon domain protein [Bacteriophage sp.]
MPTMITMQCAHCGKVFQRELHRMNHAKKFYCSQTCAAKQVAQDREGVPFEKKNFPTQTRIRITARIPVFQKLQPKVGAVYNALKFEARYGGHGGYVIESGGKKINVRLDEAVEVT